ncbi:MAG TPA: hypothetical protein VMV69_15680 [Pirellulales bacterium]|nr:hypothetical protein [Pirellulales bacterium]
MEPSRPSVRPVVLLSFVGLFVIVLRVQVSAIEATASHPRLTQPTAAESRFRLATFTLAGAAALVAAIATKRRVNRLLAVLVATAVAGLVTARYDALRGVALGGAIGSLIAAWPISRAPGDP